MFSLILASPVAQASTAGPRSVKLSGRIAGWSGKHPLYLALWNEKEFLVRPAQGRKLNAGDEALFDFDVSIGKWAVSAFEDLDGNGNLNMGMFGPTEPNGFWKPFRAWRKPRFADVAVLIDHDTANATLQIK